MGALPTIAKIQGPDIIKSQAASMAEALRGLSDAQMRAAISTGNLNEYLVAEVLEHADLNDEVRNSIATQYFDAKAKVENAAGSKIAEGANNKLAFSFKNVAKGAWASIKALAAAHPVMTMLIGLAASMLIFAKIYDALNVSFEELQKAYFEAKKAPKNEVYIEIVTENFEKVKGLVSAVTDALGEVGTGSSVFIEAVFCLYMLFEE